MSDGGGLQKKQKKFEQKAAKEAKTSKWARASLLSKKSSKKGLTRRPLFLVRVESLVCTVEMIGPSRSAGAGRDALPRVRRCTSRRFFLLLLRTRSCAIGAEAPAHQLNEVFAFLGRAMSDRAEARPYQLNVRRRIARERVPTSCKASANQIVALVRCLTYIESNRLSCRGVPCSACRSRKRSTPLADPARSVNKTARLNTGGHLLTRDSSMVPKSLLPLLPSV